MRWGAFRVAIVVAAFSALTIHAQPKVSINYESEFGSVGSNPGQFITIRGITIGNNGEIIIADARNERIQVCDALGGCFAFGSEGTGPGEFNNPHGVAVDSANRIVTVETNTDRVQIFSPEGQWLQMFGSRGAMFGQFRIPGGVWIDPSDRILVADENNNRIQICSSEGQCTGFGSFGMAPGQFATPRAVAMDGKGRILVSERDNHRISICDEQGMCTVFGQFGDEVGEFQRPRELVPDGFGNIIIADGDNDRIQICDYGGSCIVFGESGSGPGQFKNPVGVALDKQGKLYIGDQANFRVQIFSYSAQFQINSGFNDAWRNPEKKGGQGVFVVVLPDIQYVFLAWFTYDLSLPGEEIDYNVGHPSQRWYTAFGPYNGDTAELDLELNSGGVFDSAAPFNQVTDGTVTLKAISCTEMLLSYHIASADVSGEIPLGRITDDNVAYCEDLTAPEFAQANDIQMPKSQSRIFANMDGTDINAGFNDAWRNPEKKGGQGIFAVVFPIIKHVFMAWFTYDTVLPDEGIHYTIGHPSQRWYTAFGPYEGDEAVLDLELNSNGKFDSASPIEQMTDGSVTLKSIDCEEMLLEYDIFSADLQGEIPLERLAGDNVAYCASLAVEAQ
jgi:DNA-binding beta-propeller fold protein YncE